jgi:hypothetical protein
MKRLDRRARDCTVKSHCEYYKDYHEVMVKCDKVIRRIKLQAILIAFGMFFAGIVFARIMA